jgi:hypothetical protein
MDLMPNSLKGRTVPKTYLEVVTNSRLSRLTKGSAWAFR